MLDLTIPLAEGVLYGATAALAGVSLLGLAHTGGLRALFARVRTPRADRADRAPTATAAAAAAAAALVAQPATATTAAALSQPEGAPVTVATPATTQTVGAAFLAKLAAQESQVPRVQRPFACADWPSPRSFHGYALVGIRAVERGSWN